MLPETHDPEKSIPKNWEYPEKGLRKEVLDFNFISMKKPTEISKCLIEIQDIKNLNDNHESIYLNGIEEQFWIELGTAQTPIDCYIEIFIQQFLINEFSNCFIKTKFSSSEEISFKMKLLEIKQNNYIFSLNVEEIYKLATKYKENGVIMFKKYPKFAHDYFCRAAKCLLSFQPFDVLDEISDGIEPRKMTELLQIIQLNIAACLIKENRYEDVIYLTEFVEKDSLNISEKVIYRRALAFYNLKKFLEAKNTMEKINYKNSLQLLQLHQKIVHELQNDEKNYSNMVKKMFSS